MIDGNLIAGDGSPLRKRGQMVARLVWIARCTSAPRPARAGHFRCIDPIQAHGPKNTIAVNRVAIVMDGT
jgi:hypothetical protein